MTGPSRQAICAAAAEEADALPEARKLTFKRGATGERYSVVLEGGARGRKSQVELHFSLRAYSGGAFGRLNGTWALHEMYRVPEVDRHTHCGNLHVAEIGTLS